MRRGFGLPLPDNRFVYHGSRNQIASDLKATRELGVDEIFIDPTFSPAGESLKGFLSTMEWRKRSSELCI